MPNDGSITDGTKLFQRFAKPSMLFQLTINHYAEKRSERGVDLKNNPNGMHFYEFRLEFNHIFLQFESSNFNFVTIGALVTVSSQFINGYYRPKYSCDRITKKK